MIGKRKRKTLLSQAIDATEHPRLAGADEVDRMTRRMLLRNAIVFLRCLAGVLVAALLVWFVAFCLYGGGLKRRLGYAAGGSSSRTLCRREERRCAMGSETRGVDVGLLILRIGIGAVFMVFGYQKLAGGVETWTWLGGAMSHIGIGVAPAFWGFMAALAEFAGGLFLVLGLAFRIGCGLLAVTMFVAATMLLRTGAGFQKAAHAIDMLIVFVALLFTGPGGISLAARLKIPFLK